MSIQDQNVTDADGAVFWPELFRGTLIKRYKRFLADIRLHTGETVTAHCPNSGAMRACSAPGRPVYLSYHNNPKRKLKYTWELIDMPDSRVGVNTLVPNRLVRRSIAAGKVPELTGYGRIQSEVKVGNHSRLDLMLTKGTEADCYVEIKNCTLVEDGTARFPDAVTTRGQKHIAELESLLADGYRTVMFFLIQRMDAVSFRPADDIDPVYGKMLRKAIKSGVEILAYDVRIGLDKIALNQRLPLIKSP